MRVCTKSSTDVATDRMRGSASACVTANEGPKNTAAMNIMPANDGNAVERFGDRYAPNWNGTHSSVAIPGTHRYQRRSLLHRLNRSEVKPPRNVPIAPTAAKIEIQ